MDQLHAMMLMLSIFYSAESVTAVSIPSFETNKPAPVREESLILSCLPVPVFNTHQIQWYHPIGTFLCRCFSFGFCSGTNSSYTFTANHTGSYAFINRLNRTRDSGLWQCAYPDVTWLNQTVVVYASPVDVKLVPSLPPVTDLATESLTLKCQTANCTFPAPNITWYIYNMTSAQISPYSGSSGTMDSNNSPCTEEEAVYTSTLQLPRGTTFLGNTPLTTKFLCGLEHPTLEQKVKYSQHSNNVTFAVNLTFLRLKNVTGSELLGSVEVVQGTQVTFVCITSVSHPTATVNWYIEGTQINNGIIISNVTGDYGMQYVESRFTFIPSDMEHHNKTMYCQAYSYSSSIFITSSEALLFVKVDVTHAELQQSNHTVADTLNVTSWEQVTLTCVTGFSRPAPTINWYIESQWKGNGTSLTFNPNNGDHNRIIYCSAYNIDPSRPASSNKPRLYVKVSATMVTLENSTTGTIVFYDGFSQKLKCTSSPSRPSPTIRWMLESQTGSVQLTDNINNTDVINVDGLYVRTCEITITLKKENRNQKIFCNGSIDGQQIAAVSDKATIDVWHQPNKPEVQAYGVDFPWLENQNGSLKCNSSDYGNPTSNVSWISTRGNIDTNLHLVIMGLTWSDNRYIISCELVNRYTIDKDVHAVSTPINLNVEYSPRIQFNTSSPLTVNETQFLSVSCSATGNPNPNQIFWSGRPNGSLLRFENISRNDNGTYTCNATANSAKHGSLMNQMAFNIIVQYAPDVKVTVTGSTLQNMTSLVTCEASGFPSVYIFYPWRHMWGETIIRSGLQGMPTGSTGSGQNVLKLERLSLQDMGTYVCFAENRVKGINGEFIQMAAVDLNVTGVPAFLSEENNKFAGGIGHIINISIPFYSYSNVTSFMFKKNGTTVLNTNRINTHLTSAMVDYMLHDIKIQLRAQEAHLYIQNLTQEDFDNYTLILENFLGPAEFTVTLDPFGPPLMVKRFYLNRLEDQVELHFDPGFNGGRIQVFVIQYKSENSLEDWKNASILQETETQYRLPNETFAVNITKPSPGNYIYRMYSWNEIDRSPYSQEIRVFIPEVIIPPQGSSQVAAIAGGIGAAVLVIAVATIVIIVIKRRNQSIDQPSREIKERPESGLIDNPVYDSSDNLPSQSTSTSAVGTEYAVVVKSKHHQTVAKTEDPSNMYAQVEKKKMKTDKNGASKGKLGKAPRGDIYENATIVKESTSKEDVYENSKSVTVDSASENMYENPGTTSGKDSRVNKDDLHYADLMLGHPTTKAGNPVIHGLENRTEYAVIAYGKRGKPLPESEDEEKSGGAKKKNNSTKFNTDE